MAAGEWSTSRSVIEVKALLRLNAGAITPRSPQISLSKPLPSASKTPTTVQLRRCSRIDCPTSSPT